jgi:signal transduction histidine kinase
MSAAELLSLLEPRTAWLIVGVIYLLMPLAVWSVLHRRHDAQNAALWCSGASLSGVALLLFAAQNLQAPSLPVVLAGSAVAYVSYGLRWAALRRERGLPSRLGAVVATSAAALAVLAAIESLGPGARLLFNLFVYAAASWCVAAQGLDLGRECRSRSARLLGATYVLLAAALVVRALAVATGWGPPRPLSLSPDGLLVVVATMFAALWGNIGYLGFAMETAQRRESARNAELAAATARSEEAEHRAAETKALLEERQELLRVLSHEVRQPLHNAQAVLQRVDVALRDAAGPAQVAERIGRASRVLGQITASLDNVLAASRLLVGERPAALRDAELDMLVQLSVGDLPLGQRARVRVIRHPDLRTAAMDVSLMRLALRNVLANALLYSPDAAPVTLRVAETEEPLAVRFEIGDEGSGIPADLMPRLFQRGVRGRLDVPGQGLGLYIVRLAMARQGGRVDVASGPGGTVFTLTVPQGVEPG